MEDYQRLLDAAVGTAPPSTVDVNRIVLAGRRGVRLRTAGMLAGTAVAVAGMLAGTVALAGGGRPDGMPAGGPPPPAAATTRPSTPASRTPTPANTGPHHSVPAPPSAVGTAPAVPPVRPGALTLLTTALQTDLQVVIPKVAANAIAFRNSSSADSYLAEGPIQLGAGPVYLQVLIGPRVPLDCTGQAGSDTGSTCTIHAGPNRERISSWTDFGGPNPADPTRHIVLIQKLDGTDIRLSSSSLAVSASGQTGQALSISQLTRIGMDPRLAIRR